jgi:hypothetical protein
MFFGVIFYQTDARFHRVHGAPARAQHLHRG